tara:strand:+ start:587 stop:1438 length:852 start_codon:yes stop_codon:yes gene_type:complete
MKVAIIGYGFVGSALRKAFTNEVDVFIVDPKLDTSVFDLEEFEPQIVFICAPTPMGDKGEQDLSILSSIYRDLKQIHNESLIILKSTVSPENLKDLNLKYEFVYNPEFLREKTAEKDFIEGSLIIFGGKHSLCEKASDFYKKYTNCIQKEHFFTDFVTASLVKYSINSFLANKVVFFNQLKNIFEKSGAEDSWENFIFLVSKDIRIGSSHMHVPGHDGREGYGGACFPKDSAALLELSKYLGVEFSLLKESININNEIRSVYNDPMERETEQNISFGNKKQEK